MARHHAMQRDRSAGSGRLFGKFALNTIELRNVVVHIVLHGVSNAARLLF